ncbi:hypothetical protein [Roseivivax isoporae]|uniref:Sulfotransferase domain-containing protein n=1 Tax=Roseivivax isoporae LMG 25204 TaxID=1449351 RepID=X7F750_9RHOB|nr:hypothetical protein [Roseivivax isoporae]ETX28757.1 hypothetical protein RISW2_04460 [Roseivivax isoporae LMG 25204]
MQVIFHLGAHFTDDDRIVRTLARNAADWRAERVAVPGPSRYRRLLSEAVHALDEGRPAPEAREVLLETILTEDPQDVARMVLSHPNLLCVPKRALQGGILYPKAEARIAAMKDLFAGDGIEVFLALRDPATFLPVLFRDVPQATPEALMDGLDPMAFLWSDLVARLRAAHPDVPLTVWCNEDTPLIWGQVLREMAGLAPGRKIRGAFDILSEIMAPEGMKRFRAYLHQHQDLSEAHKRRVMSAFLDKYASAEAIEEELDLPGWDEDYVSDLTEGYEEDVAAIARLPGVRFIAP